MNNNKEYNLYATAAFGLEGIVGAELKRLKMQNVRAELGGARFTGTLTDAFLCNLRLRSADRARLARRTNAGRSRSCSSWSSPSRGRTSCPPTRKSTCPASASAVN